MILLALAVFSAEPVADADDALRICRPALARKAGGDIQTVSATATRKTRHGITVTGQLTAFIGMGPPQPGSASAHHLIRGDFDFLCRIKGMRVVKTTVSPRR